MDGILTYDEFLQSKAMSAEACGFDLDKDTITPMAFDYQKDIIAWACKKGKCAILTGCGTGKTLMLLEWARAVHEATAMPVLVVSPLSVVHQTVREGEKFGICAVNECRRAADVIDGVNITNYEMIEHFDASVFAGVVLDESSILKSFTGKYKTLLTDMFCHTPYRLLCTATIAPNDYTEIGTSCEFLGIMSRTEMLATYFNRAAAMANGDMDAQWLLWCDYNDESAMLKRKAMECIEVKGSDEPEFKAQASMDFADGKIHALVSKPSIFGFGSNFQSCHNMVFCGLSDSYERFYQAVRRCWRFGQEKPVDVYIILSEREMNVLDNITRKQEQMDEMQRQMTALMKEVTLSEIKHTTRITTDYKPTEEMEVPGWIA